MKTALLILLAIGLFIIGNDESPRYDDIESQMAQVNK